MVLALCKKNSQKQDEGAGWAIAPPKPLFYERADTEWDDVIEGVFMSVSECVARMCLCADCLYIHDFPVMRASVPVHTHVLFMDLFMRK